MPPILSSPTKLSVISSTQAITALNWPGIGDVRRMLYWSNPFPIYDATYIFKVFPRAAKTGPHPRYWTTFFWGNNGNFTWDNSNANTYYGAHPYPFDGYTSNSGQNWEISVYGGDYPPNIPNNGAEVSPWGRWYTQAFRALRIDSAKVRHEFYYDLPDTSKLIVTEFSDANWAKKNPPYPAIVVGQAPDQNGPPPAPLSSGKASWGGYSGWEEFNGMIRGLQIYSGKLSLTEIQAEISSPMATTTGRSLIWYLNLNPRPEDVSDKKNQGSPNNPIWDPRGTTALLWTP